MELCKGTELLAADGQSVIEAPRESFPNSWMVSTSDYISVYFSTFCIIMRFDMICFINRCGIGLDIYIISLYLHILIYY